MFKALSRSKIVGPYGQPLREAVDYAEIILRSRVSDGNLRGRRVKPSIHMGVLCSRGEWLRVKYLARLF